VQLGGLWKPRFARWGVRHLTHPIQPIERGLIFLFPTKAPTCPHRTLSASSQFSAGPHAHHPDRECLAQPCSRHWSALLSYKGKKLESAPLILVLSIEPTATKKPFVRTVFSMTQEEPHSATNNIHKKTTSHLKTCKCNHGSLRKTRKLTPLGRWLMVRIFKLGK
jgi:hypothetical protein